MRRAPRLDATQNAIVDALLRAGFRVQTLAAVGGGVADLLVKDPRDGTMSLIECKSPGGTLTPFQIKWHKWWGGVIVAQTPEDALNALYSKRSCDGADHHAQRPSQRRRHPPLSARYVVDQQGHRVEDLDAVEPL